MPGVLSSTIHDPPTTLLLAAAAVGAGWFATIIFVVDWVLRVGFALRVVWRRSSVGVSLAWLVVILTLPFVGVALYLLVGESRLGRKRAQQAVDALDSHAWFAELGVPADVDWGTTCPAFEALERMTETVVGVPALPGNRMALYANAEEAARAMIDDIRGAQRLVHGEFYIWQRGGIADEVAEALCDAARRGVTVRIAVDAVGSWRALRDPRFRQKFEQAGVTLAVSLPVGLLRMLFWRLDLRNHRKLLIVDGAVAHAGSMNMVDPKLFKRGAGVGMWIDAMVRIEGPAVGPLHASVLEDWELTDGPALDEDAELEANRPAPLLAHADGSPGAAVQAVPSGPGTRGESLAELLITAFYTAQRRLVITTPYFVPDEPMLTALRSAATRGVEVVIIVPEHLDSRLAKWACEAYLDDLLRAGVKVARFRGGLLHTKSITIDGQTTLFGTVNLDQRSLYLNFELSVFVYDERFTAGVVQLQQHYLERCRWMTLEHWEKRPLLPRLMENAARLLGPLM